MLDRVSLGGRELAVREPSDREDAEAALGVHERHVQLAPDPRLLSERVQREAAFAVIARHGSLLLERKARKAHPGSERQDAVRGDAPGGASSNAPRDDPEHGASQSPHGRERGLARNARRDRPAAR